MSFHRRAEALKLALSYGDRQPVYEHQARDEVLATAAVFYAWLIQDPEPEPASDSGLLAEQLDVDQHNIDVAKYAHLRLEAGTFKEAEARAYIEVHAK